MTVDMTTVDTQAQYDADVRNILIAGLSSVFSSPQDAALVQQLTNFLEQQIAQDYTYAEVEINLRNQQLYKDRFAGNEALKSQGLAPLDEATYLANERQYTELLRSYGLTNLANRDNFAKLIGGSVSPVELQDRVVGVYDRIKNADEALSNELQSMRQMFNVSDSDLAGALLMGSDGTQLLKRKIDEAGISAEATVRGLKSTMGAEELNRLGITRQDAAKGFEVVKQATGTLEKLSGIYGTDNTNLQNELEKEQFTGLLSKRRKSLTSKEVQTFSGKSGALTGQGIKQTSGQI
jgi:hypothetical protein